MQVIPSGRNVEQAMDEIEKGVMTLREFAP